MTKKAFLITVGAAVVISAAAYFIFIRPKQIRERSFVITIKD